MSHLKVKVSKFVTFLQCFSILNVQVIDIILVPMRFNHLQNEMLKFQNDRLSSCLLTSTSLKNKVSEKHVQSSVFEVQFSG